MLGSENTVDSGGDEGKGVGISNPSSTSHHLCEWGQVTVFELCAPICMDTVPLALKRCYEISLKKRNQKNYSPWYVVKYLIKVSFLSFHPLLLECPNAEQVRFKGQAFSLIKHIVLKCATQNKKYSRCSMCVRKRNLCAQAVGNPMRKNTNIFQMMIFKI